MCIRDRCAMISLRDAIEQYLILRRDLGFKLKGAHYLLRDFADFMQDQAAPFITTDLALQWAMRPRSVQPSYWAQRLMAVRCFACPWRIPNLPVLAPQVQACERSDRRSCSPQSW